MPEGDTIRRLAARIDHRLAGKTVLAATFRHPRLATVELERSTMHSADAYGKHLLIRFDDGRTLHAHMLMQGRVVLSRAFDVPSWRRRFEIEFPGGYLTGIDVPRLHLIRSRDEPAALAHLGPDLCGSYDHTSRGGPHHDRRRSPPGCRVARSNAHRRFRQYLRRRDTVHLRDLTFSAGGNDRRHRAGGGRWGCPDQDQRPARTAEHHGQEPASHGALGADQGPVALRGVRKPAPPHLRRRLSVEAPPRPLRQLSARLTDDIGGSEADHTLAPHPSSHTTARSRQGGRLSVATDQPVVVNDPRTGP